MVIFFLLCHVRLDAAKRVDRHNTLSSWRHRSVGSLPRTVEVTAGIPVVEHQLCTSRYACWALCVQLPLCCRTHPSLVCWQGHHCGFLGEHPGSTLKSLSFAQRWTDVWVCKLSSGSPGAEVWSIWRLQYLTHSEVSVWMEEAEERLNESLLVSRPNHTLTSRWHFRLLSTKHP